MIASVFSKHRSTAAMYASFPAPQRRNRPGWQRPGALEGDACAGERALVDIRTKAVAGVRADRRLDPGGARGRERVVPAVGEDDVRLPAVDVALGDRRRLGDPAQALGIAGGDA